MITPGTRFEGPVRIPLDHLTVAFQADYYPEAVARYYERLTDPANPHDDVLIHVTPVGTIHAPEGLLPVYRVIDGRHRYIASLLAGRRDVLALVIHEPSANARLTAIVERREAAKAPRSQDKEAAA